jgi:DNA-binding protein HU-beta
MTKQEFVARISDEAGISKADAARTLDAAIKVVEKTLARGGEINLTGFGKFSVSKRAARQGVNPQTGQPIRIAAAKTPRFSAGAKLKQAVDGK